MPLTILNVSQPTANTITPSLRALKSTDNKRGRKLYLVPKWRPRFNLFVEHSTYTNLITCPTVISPITSFQIAFTLGPSGFHTSGEVGPNNTTVGTSAIPAK